MREFIAGSLVGFLLLILTGMAISLQKINLALRELPTLHIDLYAAEAGVEQYEVTYEGELMSDLNLLLPRMKEAVEATLEAVGPNWGVFETRRGLKRQVDLVSKGASSRSDSKHLVGLAADFICFTPGGKATWNCDWNILGKACRQNGLIWGGDFQNPDPGHCEYPPLQPL